MAERTVEINTVPGWIAAGLVAVLILGTLGLVAMRADQITALSAADWAAIRFTLIQAILSALLSVILAIPVARALARRRFWGRETLISLLGAPFILPTIVAAIGLIAVFGRAGWISQITTALGLAPLQIYGFHGVIIAHVFFNMPLATRLILEGWQSIPPQHFRLAAQLGFDANAMVRRLEIPMLRRVVPGAFAVIFALCLSSFAIALVLGGGPRATTVELAIYQAFRFEFDLSKAAVLGCIQILLAGSAGLLTHRLGASMGLGHGATARITPHHATSYILKIQDFLAISCAALFLVLPLLAVIGKGLPALITLPPAVWNSALISLMIALSSTTIVLVLALAISISASTKRGGWTETSALLGIAASPLVIGTGLFLAIHPFSNPTQWVWPITILVNAIMALPFAVRSLAPAMRDILHQYGRLCAQLGLRRIAWLRGIAWPLLRRPISLSAGLAMALSIGDLGVVALFSDPDHATLPLQLYRLMGSYRSHDAQGAAVLLFAMSFGIFWAIDRWGRHADTR